LRSRFGVSAPKLQDWKNSEVNLTVPADVLAALEDEAAGEGDVWDI